MKLNSIRNRNVNVSNVKRSCLKDTSKKNQDVPGAKNLACERYLRNKNRKKPITKRAAVFIGLYGTTEGRDKR